MTFIETLEELKLSKCIVKESGKSIEGRALGFVLPFGRLTVFAFGCVSKIEIDRRPSPRYTLATIAGLALAIRLLRSSSLLA